MRKKMKRRGKNLMMVMTVFLASLFLGACGTSRSGVEIVSSPIAKVYLNGKESGVTPYRNNNLQAGEMEIRLVANEGEWEKKINLEKNITTVINWSLGGESNSGYILSMEKNSLGESILVSSSPSGAAVEVNKEIRGYTPMKINQVEAGDQVVTISHPGFKPVSLMVKIVKGYQLIIESKLDKEETVTKTSTETTPVITQKTLKVKIKSTGTGWLRVRSEANSGAKEIGKVNTGEIVELVSETSEWYQIVFEEQKGWISAKYAEKISE